MLLTTYAVIHGIISLIGIFSSFVVFAVVAAARFRSEPTPAAAT
jgi:hypothetical protein